MMDSATGFIIEPPIPWISLAPIRVSMSGARLHSSEPTAKVAKPIWKIRRRPKRSPVAPESISSEASTSV